MTKKILAFEKRIVASEEIMFGNLRMLHKAGVTIAVSNRCRKSWDIARNIYL